MNRMNLLNLLRRKGVRSKLRGEEIVIRCRINRDKIPSCSLNPVKGKWHCFSCGRGGDLTDFLEKHFGYEKRVDNLPSFDDFTVEEELPSYDSTGLDFERFMPVRRNTPAWRYLERRGLTQAEIKHYDIRETKDVSHRFYGRVIFPIIMNEKVVSFVGRDYTGEAEKKYLYPRHAKIGNYIFNYDGIVPGAMVYTTEGVFDAVKLSRRVQSAVAILGARLTPTQSVRLLERSNGFCFILDNDEAGQDGVERAIGMLKDVAFISYSFPPEGRDIDELSSKEVDALIENVEVHGREDNLDTAAQNIKNLRI